MTVLVTGGNGYIGRATVYSLYEAGIIPVVVDINSDIDTASVPVFQKIDLSRRSSVDQLALMIEEDSVTDIIHLAGRKSVKESYKRAEFYQRQNLDSFSNVLLAMKMTGVDRLVLASSAAVYGDIKADVMSEFLTGFSDYRISPYGLTKLTCEYMMQDAIDLGWLNAVALRYFNVTGTRLGVTEDTSNDALLPSVNRRLDKNSPPIIYGDGSSMRDYVHVQDVALATISALEKLRSGEAHSTVYNVGTGQGISTLTAVKEIMLYRAADLPIKYRPEREGEAATVVANTLRIRKELSWEPRYRGPSEVFSTV